MDFALFDNASLTVALALAVGVIAHVVASHTKLPQIVLMLAAGVLLGPDAADIIRPHQLGDGLPSLVGFAVAVILFEGGLQLDVKKLRKASRPIQQLITIGALATAVLGSLAAKLIMGWSWRMSMLFGTLIIVTGPTVITPLLRRLRCKRTAATVLEAEGVLIDAIGAIIAAVGLEIALSPSGESIALGALEVVKRIGVGAGFGALAGLAMAGLLRARHLVPEGLENILALGLTLALFQLANALLHESGIAAVTVAGIIVGNAQTRVQRTLVEFKEQLTAMLIGMLFVLLAADVRLADVRALGYAGLATVIAVVLVVRPLSVAVGTARTKLTWRQRAFIAWIGPRGIVAAAVASLFATELQRRGIEGGQQLRALVFLVIAISVTWSSLTGGYVAELLELRRPSNQGWALLGANELARTVARLLQQSGEDVVCIESNQRFADEARAEGIQVVEGNGLKDTTLQSAEIDTRAGAIGLTGNEELNYLFAQGAKLLCRKLAVYVAIVVWDEGITAQMVHKLSGQVFAGGAEDIGLWSARIRHGTTEVQWWRLKKQPIQNPDGEDDDAKPGPSADQTAAALSLVQADPAHREGPYLPLVARSKSGVLPVGDQTGVGDGRAIAFLIDTERDEHARDLLTERGFMKL